MPERLIRSPENSDQGLSVKLLFSLLFSAAFCGAQAQSCFLRVNPDLPVRGFEEELAVFLSLKFTVNGISFGTTTSGEKQIPVLQNGFDTIRYSYFWRGKRIEASSLCKFRSNEHYVLSPCTCCGIFLIVPETKAERGFVQFVNESRSLYWGSASELDYDSIPAMEKTPFLFSSISMNCGFRPSQIVILEPAYFDPKYTYEKLSVLPEEAQNKLEAEQRTFIRYAIDFLFLHGEKLVLSISEDASEFVLKLE